MDIDITKLSPLTDAEMRQMDQTFKDILTSIPHGVCHEKLFVEVFLPWFCGEISDEELPTGIDSRTWSRIAGTPDNYVDIVDDNQNVLFSVPPYMAGKLVDITNESNISIPNAYREITEVAKTSPFLAKKMEKELYEKIKVTPDTEKYHEYMRTWAWILDRYGILAYDPDNTLPTVDENGELTNQDTKQDESDLDDIISGYD